MERQIRLREIVKCLRKLVLGSNVQPIFERGTSITPLKGTSYAKINAAAGRAGVVLRN